MNEDERVSGSLAAAALDLARRFAAGATMWCVAPEWSSHGGHVAVEFVHPVIVGKRSLPAVHVTDKDPVPMIRLCSRPGDVLLVASSARDRSAAGLLRRAPAWGLERFWLGAGPAPAPGSAEHVIWWEEIEPDVASRSGDVVVLYHLLWELTHVVFEHPGLLGSDSKRTDEVCITCSDEGRVAEIRDVFDHGQARAVVEGSVEEIDVSLIEPVRDGDLVLVHAGVAVTSLPEDLT